MVVTLLQFKEGILALKNKMFKDEIYHMRFGIDYTHISQKKLELFLSGQFDFNVSQWSHKKN